MQETRSAIAAHICPFLEVEGTMTHMLTVSVHLPSDHVFSRATLSTWNPLPTMKYGSSAPLCVRMKALTPLTAFCNTWQQQYSLQHTNLQSGASWLS
jgi:hypothetical protein